MYRLAKVLVAVMTVTTYESAYGSSSFGQFCDGGGSWFQWGVADQLGLQVWLIGPQHPMSRPRCVGLKYADLRPLWDTLRGSTLYDDSVMSPGQAIKYH